MNLQQTVFARLYRRTPGVESLPWHREQPPTLRLLGVRPGGSWSARSRSGPCDIVEYEAPAPFDVVLDSGCLHHLPKAKFGRYRKRLDEWLAPGGDYVLVHFAHRPRVFRIPGGPRHMSRDEAVAAFAPLALQAHDETQFDVPLPMGRMRAGVYWFSRPEH